MPPDGRSEPTTDVVVVGGGAAGLAAATAARAAGLAVTLVSEGPLGGDCTWHGCVPTKSVLEAAAAGAGAAEALAHARAVVGRVARTEGEPVLRGAGVDVVRARATLHAGPAVRLGDGGWLRPARGVVLATGSRPLTAAALGLPAPTGRTVVTTTDGWLDAVERHLRERSETGGAGPAGPVVVVGGGPSGVELAQALARLGVGGDGADGRRAGGLGAGGRRAGGGRGGEDGSAGRVVLLEREATLLPEVPGAGAVVAASLVADGVDVRTGVVEPTRTAPLLADAGLVVLAAGREPVLDVLAPDSGVATGPRGVLVDETTATTAPGVWAAGDVTGLRPSTHLAAAAGRAAVAGLLGRPLAVDAAWVPQVVYTDPEVAVVGRPAGRSVRVPLSRSDRALAAAVRDPSRGPGTRPWTRGGFVRVWVDDGPGGGRVTGAVLVGPHAGELVAEVALVGRLGVTVEQWAGGRVGLGAAGAHHAYPTWSWLWQPVLDRLLGR